MRIISTLKALPAGFKHILSRARTAIKLPQPGGCAAAVSGLSAALLVNICIVLADDKKGLALFDRLTSAFSVLYSSTHDLVGTIANFALVVCIVGLMVAPMLGSKATSTMLSSLKMVLGGFIFWQLLPVVLTTLTDLFGSTAT